MALMDCCVFVVMVEFGIVDLRLWYSYFMCPKVGWKFDSKCLVTKDIVRRSHNE